MDVGFAIRLQGIMVIINIAKLYEEEESKSTMPAYQMKRQALDTPLLANKFLSNWGYFLRQRI